MDELATCNTGASDGLAVGVEAAGESDLQINKVEQLFIDSSVDRGKVFSIVAEASKSVSSNGNSSSVKGFS